MGLILGGDELSLGCNKNNIDDYSSSFPCTIISDFLKQVSMITNVSEKLIKFDEFIKRLEDEFKKIEGFKRELPLCMILLNHAIDTVKEERMQCVLEQSEDTKEKMNWLSSVKLWNTSIQNQDITKRIDDEVHPAVLNDPIKASVSQSMRIGSLPIKGYSEFQFSVVGKDEDEDSPGLSLRTPGIKTITHQILVGKTSASRNCSNGRSSVGGGIQLQQQSTRKQRRCWSPDLHRQFFQALEQLGGSQVATPKQIRDHMQVDGLTNDEVKSHLQKYRLHVRRTPSVSGTAPNQSIGSGDLWSSQDQCSETLKLSNSQSGSPSGPLHFGGTSQGTSMTGCDDIRDEDEEKSESYSLKFHAYSSATSNI